MLPLSTAADVRQRRFCSLRRQLLQLRYFTAPWR